MACHALWLASLACLHTCAVTFATTAPRLSEAQNMASAWSPPLVRTSSQRNQGTSQVHHHCTHSIMTASMHAFCMHQLHCVAAKQLGLSLDPCTPTHHIKATACRSPSSVAVRQVVSAVVYELLPTSAHIQSATIEVDLHGSLHCFASSPHTFTLSCVG